MIWGTMFNEGEMEKAMDKAVNVNISRKVTWKQGLLKVEHDEGNANEMGK